MPQTEAAVGHIMDAKHQDIDYDYKNGYAPVSGPDPKEKAEDHEPRQSEEGKDKEQTKDHEPRQRGEEKDIEIQYGTPPELEPTSARSLRGTKPDTSCWVDMRQQGYPPETEKAKWEEVPGSKNMIMTPALNGSSAPGYFEPSDAVRRRLKRDDC